MHDFVNVLASVFPTLNIIDLHIRGLPPFPIFVKLSIFRKMALLD